MHNHHHQQHILRPAAAPLSRERERAIIDTGPATIPGTLSREELRALVAQMID